MFLWLSLDTFDTFRLLLPPSVTFCNVLNTFLLQAPSWHSCLGLVGVAAIPSSTGTTWSLTHTCIQVRGLLHKRPSSPAIHARSSLRHDWSVVYARCFPLCSLGSSHQLCLFLPCCHASDPLPLSLFVFFSSEFPNS